MRIASTVLGLAASWIALGLGLACTSERRPEVVVYTALDPVFSRAIFADFERETGIAVRAVTDTEATKTTGLVERLRRERARPRCDVFWNNEILRTIRLADEGVLAPYVSPSAADIPARYRDPAGHWSGFAARARAVAFDPQRTPAATVPRGHAGLLDARWHGRVSVADPRFGTTGSHLACLLVLWGEERLRAYLGGLRDNGVQVVGGNATSRDHVLSGEVDLGLTDTDDVEVVRRRGESIDDVLYPDDGAIVLPNTIALVAGAPHPEAARRFIDYALSAAVEERLAASPSRQIPLRADVPVPASGLRLADLKAADIDFPAAARALPRALEIAQETLLAR